MCGGADGFLPPPLPTLRGAPGAGQPAGSASTAAEATPPATTAGDRPPPTVPPQRPRRLRAAGGGAGPRRGRPRAPPADPLPGDPLSAHAEHPAVASLSVDGLIRSWLLPWLREDGGGGGGGADAAAVAAPGGLTAAGLAQAVGYSTDAVVPGHRAEQRNYLMVG